MSELLIKIDGLGKVQVGELPQLPRGWRTRSGERTAGDLTICESGKSSLKRHLSWTYLPFSRFCKTYTIDHHANEMCWVKISNWCCNSLHVRSHIHSVNKVGQFLTWNPTSAEICFSQPKRSKGTSATSTLYKYFLGQLRKCDNFCQNLTWGMTISLNFASGWRDRTDQFLVDLSLLSLDFLPTHQSQLLMKHETDHAEIRGRHKNWKEKTKLNLRLSRWFELLCFVRC